MNKEEFYNETDRAKANANFYDEEETETRGDSDNTDSADEGADKGVHENLAEEDQVNPEPVLSGITVSVPMKAKYLFGYHLMHFYTSLRGWIGIVLSILCLVIFFVGEFDNLWIKISFLFGGLLFTVLNPLFLLFRANQQYALIPVYKKPIAYTFAEEGIQISQDALRQTIGYGQIYRVRKGMGLLVIYTSPAVGSIIPYASLTAHKEIEHILLEGCKNAGVTRISKSIGK